MLFWQRRFWFAGKKCSKRSALLCSLFGEFWPPGEVRAWELPVVGQSLCTGGISRAGFWFCGFSRAVGIRQMPALEGVGLLSIGWRLPKLLPAELYVG
mmetsp:Transcript_93393/g.168717  ORF Transcript_93393/g.168717 Transcript_93393/m.168717 type:complete len:98 (+) Transcript_93393:119-412(+)